MPNTGEKKLTTWQQTEQYRIKGENVVYWRWSSRVVSGRRVVDGRLGVVVNTAQYTTGGSQLDPKSRLGLELVLGLGLGQGLGPGPPGLIG